MGMSTPQRGGPPDRHPSGQKDMNDQRGSQMRGPFGLRDQMDMWVTEKQIFKLREHKTPSQVGWGRGRESWRGAQGDCWWGMSTTGRAGEGLSPRDRGTGPSTFVASGSGYGRHLVGIYRY